MTDKRWTIINADGTVAEPCTMTSGDPPPLLDGQAVFEIDGHDPARQVWGGTSWVTNVEFCRARKWEEAKAYRALKQAEPVNGADATPEGRAFVESMARMAAVDDAVTLHFKQADNSYVDLNAAQIIELANAMLLAYSTCHAVCQAHEAAIFDPEATAEEVEAIDVTAGY